MAVPETTARATAAVDELYRRHVGDVYRYTYAVLGNHADAEDVTQTTFVNALRAMERGESPEEPERWLMVIAHNLVRQRWRQAAARPTVVELETDVPDAVDEDEQYELEELVRALQRIPETQREALVMRELEGRSYRDIAAVMGLTTSALETVLFRARRSLADELENVVTCQNAELAISKRLDGRLSRKERRRLEEHLAECPDCARLAAFETRQRKAFKGLALLPLPVGLALFKGAPSAAAATSLPTIGLAASGGETAGVGAAGAGAGTATGGAAAGGSLAGGLALKVAAIAATITVAAGVGYKGIQALRDDPSSSKTAAPHVEKASSGGARLAAPATPPRTTRRNAHTPTPHAAAKHPAVSHPSAGTPTPAAPASSQTHTPPAVAAGATTSASDQAQTPVAPKIPAPEHPAAPTDGATPTPKPTPVASPGSSNGAPKTSPPRTSAPKAGTTSPGGATSGGAPPATGPGSGTTGGGTTTPTAPPAATPPSSPPAGSGVTPPVVTPPASSPPGTTPETPATPPTTTPPSTPPSDQPPGDTGSGSTGGDTSGSTGDTGSGDGSPSQGTDPWEQGQKNGHHKGNHDDKHPGDS